MVVAVKKVGGSVAVIIPKAIATELQFLEGTEVDLSTDSGAMIVRRRSQRTRRPLKKLVAQINSKSYQRQHGLVSDDAPVGKEAW